MTEKYILDGRVYRTKVDYQLAVKDKSRIDELKKQYKYPDDLQLEALYKKLKEQKMFYHTIMYDNFIEEIEEKLQRKKETPNLEKKKVIKAPLDEKMMEQVQLELRKRERRRKIILVSCFFVALFSFSYVAYILSNDTKSEQLYNQLAQLKEDIADKKEEEPEYTVTLDEVEEKDLTILPEYETLYNLNKKLIGWIKIDDTNIDYPVMQTSDNEYYLTHNINQEYDKNGSIFLDKNCDIINRNMNLIIYGHRMSSGNMFGKLDKYKKEDYYKEHKYITFDTIYEKGTYEVVYAFQTQIYKETEITFKFYQFFDVNSEKEFNSSMDQMSELSLYDTGIVPEYGDEFITLATCDYYTSYGRFVVVARKIK